LALLLGKNCNENIKIVSGKILVIAGRDTVRQELDILYLDKKRKMD